MGVSGIAGRTGSQIQSLVGMRRQLDDLYRQLSTGQRSTSYAGLGLDRGLSMALRSQVAAIGSFQQTATSVGTRLGIVQNVLTQIDGAVHVVKRTTTNATTAFNSNGQTDDQATALGQLDLILGSLNARIGDQYLFSGQSADLESVGSLAHILDGDGTRAGFRQIVAERLAADLGANSRGRLNLPAVVTSSATLVGTGAAIAPDAPAVVTGTQDLSGAYTSPAGGTLIINGTTVTINVGDDGTDVLNAINAPAITALTGVTATLNVNGRLVLTSADADTAIDIGAGSTLLAEFGVAAVVTDPTNLLTQGAVTAGQNLTVTIAGNPPLTITFGTVNPDVSTLAELDAQLATLIGSGASAASVDPLTGNITITATGTTNGITVAGSANAATFGLATTSDLPSNVATIAEDAAGHPFGFKLRAYTSNLTGASVATGGPPDSYSVDFTGNPVAGQAFNISFDLPDGTNDAITLTATAASPAGPGEFTIGANPTATAANFRAALDTAVGKLAATALTAASAFAAADNFFNISAATAPQRVDGPPFDSATALVAGTSTNTVSWYKGEAGASLARSTATARVDTSITISFGMRANEQSLRTAVASMAVHGVMTYSGSDPNAAERYRNVTQRVGTTLAGPPGTQRVTDIEAEIANAQTVMQAATDRHQQSSAALAGMLDSVSNVSNEQVGAEILALQTRLQASLQTTALLSKTSLVYFLSA
jgi:hypothetical protein